MPDLSPGTVAARLHARDGQSEGDTPSLHHFRLVGESPRGGLSIGALFERRSERTIPYKLFEIVPGAVIEVSAPPGTSVAAEAQIQVRPGRRFNYRSVGQADEEGRARLRVAYPTRSEGGGALFFGAEAMSGYRIRAGQLNLPRVQVPEDAVREGRVLQGASVLEPS